MNRASVLVWAVAGLTPFIFASTTAPTSSGATAVVIVAPWKNASAEIYEAGGAVIAPGRLPFTAAAQALDDEFGPRLAQQVGVWFLDAELASLMCRES